MFLRRPQPEQERRKYLRLDTVFPVEFRLSPASGTDFLCDWLQGFTRDISKGGICLVINNLPPQLVEPIKIPGVKIHMRLELPFTKNVVSAKATIAWVQEISTQPYRYRLGLTYEEINPQQNNLLMRYARVKKLFVPVVLSIILLLAAGFGANTFINIRLIQGNRALVSQLVNILQESSVAKQDIKEISRQREDLQLEILTLQKRLETMAKERIRLEQEARLKERARLKEEAQRREKESSPEIQKLSLLIDQLTQEKNSLQEKLISLQSKESTVAEDLLRLDKRKVRLEKVSLEKMYQWLTTHQNPRTGLVMSFEGDSDINNWAFIYDQSLVSQAYTYFADYERSRRLFDFFAHKAERRETLFLNAYYVTDGSPAEYIVHSGPNIWLGIAVLQYTYKSKDQRFFHLAEEIAETMINLQNQDKEKGLRGGPQLHWYSTEHNLDAYAFFNMLYKMTGQEKYREAREKILQWLLTHIYDKVEVPVVRGKGDATIATDTYAWSIAAIGPEKLQEIGMNPDKILEFAEKTCSVETLYSRPEGKTLKIKGFDFAAQRNLARGGVVSSEWTAQMILAFKIMADFYYHKGLMAKGRDYERKADEYLAELCKMIISSPSPSGQGEGCLPYASQESVDTGHGWITPRGKSTGSVAGTSYTIFAYYKYNPLELKE